MANSDQSPKDANLDSRSESTGKRLSPQAQRALAEAAERRSAQEAHKAARERDGPAGVEPTRFGDWERKGIAYDF